MKIQPPFVNAWAKLERLVSFLFPARLYVHGHDACTMSHQSATTYDNALAGLPGFWVVR